MMSPYMHTFFSTAKKNSMHFFLNSISLKKRQKQKKRGRFNVKKKGVNDRHQSCLGRQLRSTQSHQISDACHDACYASHAPYAAHAANHASGPTPKRAPPATNAQDGKD
jgi:hypothetical protein